jgi:hypothetical protein
VTKYLLSDIPTVLEGAFVKNPAPFLATSPIYCSSAHNGASFLFKQSYTQHDNLSIGQPTALPQPRRDPMAQPTNDLPAGTKIDVFCETCWRIWPYVLQQSYCGTSQFDETNRLRCPICDGGHCRAARLTDVTVKPKGGDRI